MDVELCLKEMGRRIMERRKGMGLTQEALAEKSDLTTQFVSYAESGKRGMRPENLMKMAEALGVSTDYLLTGDIIDKDKLLLSDKLDRLKATLSTLTDLQRDTIYKKFYRNMSNVDIAAEEGVSETAIRNRLKKIYAQLGKKI